ncbi:MAG: hypothetical protein DI535_28410 [Citrobacter freundii]|nr:MAG: hypothetical protein DI535_28410 [Citrobacter freundii]
MAYNNRAIYLKLNGRYQNRAIRAKKKEQTPEYQTLKTTGSNSPDLNNSLHMFKMNLKIAWRHIIKDRLYSSINIIGLSAGIGFTLLIAATFMDDSLKSLYRAEIQCN